MPVLIGFLLGKGYLIGLKIYCKMKAAFLYIILNTVFYIIWPCIVLHSWLFSEEISKRLDKESGQYEDTYLLAPNIAILVQYKKTNKGFYLAGSLAGIFY